ASSEFMIFCRSDKEGGGFSSFVFGHQNGNNLIAVAAVNAEIGIESENSAAGVQFCQPDKTSISK
ncbi:MAG: hypothetical protein M3Y82_05605, partial [Verrucomicrobiota bacterium]|nr:hypothetical protein [Verrucomicrobiota bacterium]